MKFNMTLIVIWIVMGIVTILSLYITNDEDYVALLGLPFLATLFDMFLN